LPYRVVVHKAIGWTIAEQSTDFSVSCRRRSRVTTTSP
jgi:hypothetical protein